ncbi:zinc finger protein 771 isoform X2 [Nilaparvata lugens]|nr:zinc finger protein 771 isoform X2 [Nilaparvata lugens]
MCVAADSKFNFILDRHCSSPTHDREPVSDGCSLKEVSNCIWSEDAATKSGKTLTVHDRNVIVLSKLDSSALQLQPEPNRDFVVMVELKYKDPDHDHVKSEDLVAIDCDQAEIQENDDCLSTDLMFFQSDDSQNKSSEKYLRLISNNSDTDGKSPAKIANNIKKKGDAGTGVGAGLACSVCGKQFQRRTRLNSHMALHTQVRPHTCDECGKTFAMRWDLTLHRRLHTAAFACPVCHKSFTANSKLNRHLRTHTGERPHACAHCHKSFADKRNLDNHTRTHTGEKPYVCRVCARAFRVRTHLTDHQRVHSKATPYKCALCPKTFRWKANYNLHCKTHGSVVK